MLYLTFLIIVFHFSSACSQSSECSTQCLSKELFYYVVGSDYRHESEDIWYPCPLNDIDCMRDYLAANSRCIPRYGNTPDPIQLPVGKFFFPVSSMTVSHFEARCRGFRNAEIKHFYVNRDTNNLVIAITVPAYNFSSDSWFTYQRPCEESVSLNDYSTFQLDFLTLTAIIPKIPDLRMELAEIFALVPNKPPKSYIGPGAYTSNDPIVNANFAAFEANIVTIIKEVFVFHGPLLMTTFIQSELCDFGVNVHRNLNGQMLGKCTSGY